LPPLAPHMASSESPELFGSSFPLQVSSPSKSHETNKSKGFPTTLVGTHTCFPIHRQLSRLSLHLCKITYHQWETIETNTEQFSTSFFIIRLRPTILLPASRRNLRVARHRPDRTL
jgi:hypothetical protein